jgi:hypothetical protein
MAGCGAHTGRRRKRVNTHNEQKKGGPRRVRRVQLHCHFWARPLPAMCRFSSLSAPVSAHTSLLLVAFSMPDFNRAVVYNLWVCYRAVGARKALMLAHALLYVKLEPLDGQLGAYQ